MQAPKQLGKLQESSMTGKDFMAAAEEMSLEVFGNKLTGEPRTFSSGAYGWYLGGKIEVSASRSRSLALSLSSLSPPPPLFWGGVGGGCGRYFLDRWWRWWRRLAWVRGSLPLAVLPMYDSSVRCQNGAVPGIRPSPPLPSLSQVEVPGQGTVWAQLGINCSIVGSKNWN